MSIDQITQQRLASIRRRLLELAEFRQRMLAPTIAFLGSTILRLTPRLWFTEWRERDALLREWRDGQGNEPF